MKVFNKFFIAIIFIILINFCTNLFAANSWFNEYQEKALKEQSISFSSKVLDFLKNAEYLNSDSDKEKEKISQFLNSKEDNLKELFYNNFYFYMHQIKCFKNLKSSVTKITENAEILKESTYKFFISFVQKHAINLKDIFERSKNNLKSNFKNIGSEFLTNLFKEISKSLFSRMKEKFSWFKRKIGPDLQNLQKNTQNSTGQQPTVFTEIQQKITQVNNSSDLDISKKLIRDLLQDINQHIDQAVIASQLVDLGDNASRIQEFLDMYKSVDKLFKGYWTGFEKEVLNLLKELNSSVLRLRVLHDNLDKLPVKKDQFTKLKSLIDEYLDLKEHGNRGFKGFVKQIPVGLGKCALNIAKIPAKSAIKWVGNVAGTTFALLTVAGVANVIYFKNPDTGAWQAFIAPFKNLGDLLIDYLLKRSDLEKDKIYENSTMGTINKILSQSFEWIKHKLGF
ncbi:MAG: hypothetical protein WC436_03005 [Candidatus Babeliales bacterium]